MRNQLGFTFIELIVVIGIAAILFGFVTINLVSQQRNVSVNAVSDTLVSDIYSQQTKAMVGLGSTSGTSYGIYFASDKYTLFKGSTYSSNDSANFTVSMDSGIAINNIKFTNNVLVFSPGSGAVSGFSSGNDSITISDLNGTKTETITVNRYGVVTGEN